MKHAEYFRKLARLCRVLSKNTVDPLLVDQMRVWAIDFAKEADKAEGRVARHDRHLMTGSAGRAGHTRREAHGQRKRR
jgi:conjugal transfer/entry exclusion protein